MKIELINIFHKSRVFYLRNHCSWVTQILDALIFWVLLNLSDHKWIKVWQLYWFQFLCHPVVKNEVHGIWVQVYHLMYFNYCKIGLILSHWFLCSAVQTSFDYIISFKSCWHSVRYKTLPEVPELELKWGWVGTCEWEILFLFLRVQDHPPCLTHQDSWTQFQFIDACLSLWFFGSVVKRLEIIEY